MRKINIYRDDGKTMQPVALGCIQTGSTGIDRTPNNKFFEMADGTCACYPCQTAKAEMTLTLECDREQADGIDRASHCGALYFDGIRFGAQNVIRSSAIYRAFLCGKIRIEEKYYKTGIYSVTIPLRFDVSGENYRTVG